MASRGLQLFIFFAVVLFLSVSTHAFGAGNIASFSRVEGQNWRHGDIEDTLLGIHLAKVAGGKKFRGLDVKRVYFGNWLRDYSQAVDVGTVKHIPAEAIRILLWILAFLSFGYGTGEFEVTTERLGCYRPEEHIDNPKDYADNVDARQFDARLRGPVNEAVELAIDPRTGLKMYIASEDHGITTSAGLVRDLFGRCIYLGRQYGRTKNKADLYEAFRLLGTACHCLEDYGAHSNYVELALRNCGEEEIFPLVGRQATTQVQGVNHPIFPIVTGTFGSYDFLHSVLGEFSDHVTQSEIEELEGSVASAQSQQNPSVLKDLLSKLPSGIFGGKNEVAKIDELQANATAHQMSGLQVTPQSGPAWMQQLGDTAKQIYPVMEFHDEVMMKISNFVEHIPILPSLIEKIQEQINVFVFSLLAPYVLPVIKQVKSELAFGSSEVIESSRAKQLNIFKDDYCTDPTHSMMSKDHFSNVLNEPAGKVASQVLKWVVPQVMAAWDDERIDVNSILNRIINGVFHHPALRDQGQDGARECRQSMFQVVQTWWRNKSEPERQLLRSQLSRDGVENGRNHKQGVKDTGHGSCKPTGITAAQAVPSPMMPGGTPMANFPGGGGFGMQQAMPAGVNQISNLASSAVGGGAMGGLVGGLVGKVGSSLLGNTFGGKNDEIYNYQQQSQNNNNNSFTSTYTQTGHHPAEYNSPEKYGQAQYQQTNFPGGGSEQIYQRYEQDVQGGTSGYGFQEKVDTTPAYGGGYDQTTEQSYTLPGGQWETQTQHEHVGPHGQHLVQGNELHGGKGHHKKDSGSDSDSDSDGSSDGRPGNPEKKERKRLKRERKRREREERKRREQEQFGQGQGEEQSGEVHPHQHPHHPHPNQHHRPAEVGGNGYEQGGYGAAPEFQQYDGRYQNMGQPPYMPPAPLATAAAASAWENRSQSQSQSQYQNQNHSQNQNQQPYQPYGHPGEGAYPAYGGGYGSQGPDNQQGYGQQQGGQYGEQPYGGSYGGGQGYGGNEGGGQGGMPGGWGYGGPPPMPPPPGPEWQGGVYGPGPGPGPGPGQGGGEPGWFSRRGEWE